MVQDGLVEEHYICYPQLHSSNLGTRKALLYLFPILDI
jgi:hypothetical protein